MSVLRLTVGAGVGGAKRVLIVEDEILVGMLVETMLADLGYVAAGIAPRLEDAFAVPQDSFDVALLDIHLSGREVFPFAEILAASGKPFAFATGYGGGGIPAAHRERPVLQKPFQEAELKNVLSALTAA